MNKLKGAMLAGRTPILPPTLPAVSTTPTEKPFVPQPYMAEVTEGIKRWGKREKRGKRDRRGSLPFPRVKYAYYFDQEAKGEDK